MQANRSEVLFVDYIMEHINPTTGRAAVIVPEGIIFQSATAYKALRKLLVEKNFLYGVVSLPAGLFQPYSGVKTSILLLDRTLAKKTDKILFVKIENDGYSLGAQRKELTTSDLPDATNFIKQYITAIRNNDFSLIDFEHLPLNSIAVERNRITENGDYNLSGDRYKDSIAKKQSKFDLVELSEVCDLYQPQTISASDFKENGEYKVFGANGVIGNYDKYNHEDSEVLITCRGATCGTINFSEPKSWITGNAMVAKPIDNRINKRFLFHLLKASDLSSVITGAAQPQITRASLSPFKIPLPPITVQSEIETKIEQFEKIITGAKLVVENYKPQIDIKPEWEMVELGEISDKTQIGLVKNSGEQGEYSDIFKFPYLKMDAITYDGELNFDKTVYVDATKEELEKFTLDDGDFFYNTRNTPELVGKSAVYHGESGIYLFNNNLFRIKFNDKANPDFINIFLNSNTGKQIIRTLVSGTTSVAALYQKEFMKIRVPLPPIEQQNILISEIEKEKNLIEANKRIIEVFEQKIKDEINKLWEE